MRAPRSARIRALWLAFALGIVGCKSDGSKGEPEQVEPQRVRRAGDKAGAAALLGPLVLSDAVPVVVAGVGVLRLPQGIASASPLLDPLAPPGEDASWLARDIDAYLTERFGVRISKAHALTLFALPAPLRFGVIVRGVEGTPTSAEGPLESHRGTAIFGVEPPEWVMAGAGEDLVIGHVEAVRAALDARSGARPRLRDAGGELVQLVEDYGDDASLLVVADVAALDLAPLDPVAAAGVERAAIALAGSRLTAAITGEQADLDVLAGVLRDAFSEGASELSAMHLEAVRDDEPLAVIGALIAQHNLRRLQTQLEPKLGEGRFTLSLDLGTDDGLAIAHLAGLVSAVAVPALTKYLRGAKTEEARQGVREMVFAAGDYFDEERIVIEVVPGRGTVKNRVHVCPNDGPTHGEAGITPPLSVDCNEGPGGRCVPGSSAPGGYPAAAWDHPVWKKLEFSQRGPHYFHYNFRYENDPRGFGSCRFTAQAFADLDDDGVFSTYEYVGKVDAGGLDASAGLSITDETE